MDKAHSVALEKLMEKTEDEKKRLSLNWALDGLKAKIERADVEEEILKKYVGKYTRGEIALENSQLFLEAGSQKFKMIPLTETYFILDGEPSIRVEFTLDDTGKEYEIIAHFRDGRKEVVKRVKGKK